MRTFGNIVKGGMFFFGLSFALAAGLFTLLVLLPSWLIPQGGFAGFLGELLLHLKFLVLLFVLIMPVASLLTWAERRQSAMMQDRLGPNRANIGRFRLWGILHFVADAGKMIFKEDFVPGRAHRWLFGLAPIMAVTPVLIVFAIVPFGPDVHLDQLWQVVDPDRAQAASTASMQIFRPEFGLLFYFAIASLANFGATLAGWASYNKFALLGGLRASSQMLSYEVAMGLAILGVFLVMGTLEPSAIVGWQGENPLNWGVVVQPLAFLLFFVAVIAETKRAPFDLPEGEPEIVGYFVEYSGRRWGLFFLGEFIEIVFASAILVTVFFGGYHFPGLHADGLYFTPFVNAKIPMAHGLVVLLQMFTFVAKVMFFCWLQLLIRWTLPRFRPDQLMNLGWKKLLPASLVNVMLTAAFILWSR